MADSRPIKELAEEWIAIDHDPQSREEIVQLQAANDEQGLEERLRTRIGFGTAGLRARMGAGYSRMNCVTVIQASQGLAAYILAQIPNAKHCGVAIGYDARHNSHKFAKLAAAAFVAKNIKVWWFERPVHTPLVPFAINELGCAAGVMITASHNPPQDNGYKVYWQNGCQIIPPHDSGIAQAILQNLEIVSWDKKISTESLLVESALEVVLEKYLTAVKTAADPYEQLAKHISPENGFNFAYTAMHGVGLLPMTKAMDALGLSDYLHVVQEQAHPDPDFPGLPFPNPEEKGALEVAMWSADRKGISLILATDPDADRLAVAEKVDGEWKQLTGNQLGILLASHVLETYDKPRDNLAMIASTVSSKMLAVMAEHEKFYYAETLTGFKWMGNKSLQLDTQGYDTRLAFEESIGYMIPGVVKDKDGIAAAATFLCAVARWRHDQDMTPWQKLQSLYKKYDYFVEANTYFISPSPKITKNVFDSIRKQGDPHLRKLGHRKVTYYRDLTEGWESSTKDHKPLLPVDPTSEMITFELERRIRVTIRASGTEPKIKLYVDSRRNVEDDAWKAALQVRDAFSFYMLNPRLNPELAGIQPQDPAMFAWWPTEKYGPRPAQ